MGSDAPIIVWFRLDLRLSDNPALRAAAEEGPVIPVYVLDDEAPGDWRMGGASRWWLHHSLASLDRDLRDRGGRLLLLRGPAQEQLMRLVERTGAAAVHWNRRYEPWAIARDGRIKEALTKSGTGVRSFNAQLLFEPWTVRNSEGSPYQVYSPFARACRRRPEPPRPLPEPEELRLVSGGRGVTLKQLGLLPGSADWAGSLEEAWTPGEAPARERLEAFLDGPVGHYAEDRDRPDLDVTSRLSPHLHFGEIGPRTIWHGLREGDRRRSIRGREVFLNEVLWREFAHHLLHHFPQLPEEPLDEAFGVFPWREDPEAFVAWQNGLTGYPIVDAGMRQLRRTGWMHNRVRMVVGSFLVKDLMLPWQAGEAWFWDNLVDADLANNTLGWQWLAGCGPDAAPYFRIFNPVRQGERFDPGGDYVRRWLPELAALPDEHIHAPWQAPEAVLAEAGVRLGDTYPRPIVDHGAARDRALRAFEEARRGAGGRGGGGPRRRGGGGPAHPPPGRGRGGGWGGRRGGGRIFFKKI
jgi:deoxyribodipyrimidine photo-lyase